MDNDSRTPLGELLVSYRRLHGLAQYELANRTAKLAQKDRTVAPVSRRTVVRLETAKEPRRTQLKTVHSLAVTLGLEVGTPAYNAFMEAARPSAGSTPASAVAGSEAPAADVIEAGRTTSLRSLGLAFDRAANGAATAVVVRGEDGTGKSTIVAHACNLALARHPGTVVLWASASEHDPEHGPFLSVLLQMVGDPDLASTESQLLARNRDAIIARAPVAAKTLASEAPLLAALALSSSDDWRKIVARVTDPRVADQLAHLATTPANESMRIVSGCEQFYRLISHYAAEGPVILVFDDLNRADPASLGSLEHLLSRIQQRHALKLAIVGIFLPDRQIDDDGHRLSGVLEGVRHLPSHGAIDLDAATSGDSARRFAEAALARAALPTDRATVGAVIERTGGNARYVVELVDALSQHREPGTEDIVPIINSLVPPDLGIDLGARVRRLPETLRNILHDASVLGSEFDAETLMAMQDLTPPRYIELVDRQLWRRLGLVRGTGTELIGGRVTHTYEFNPPLLRDALYEGLSRLERSHAHGRAADALLRLHGDAQHERLERLAGHLESAARLNEAARAYLEAGNHARARRDFKRARILLDRIEPLGARMNDPATWIRTQIALGLCARSTGDRAGAQLSFNRALDLASAWHDDLVLASALEAAGMLEFDTGELIDGRDHILRAVEIWAAHDAPETGRALANLSYLLAGSGRYVEAISSAERARREATRTGQAVAWIDGTLGLAYCWLDLGRYDRAAELYENAAMVGNEHGDVHRQRICWINLALIAVERGDWGAAELSLDHVIEDDEPLSAPMEGIIAFHSGLIAEGRGSTVAARAHFALARELRDKNEEQALAIDAVAGELRSVLAQEDLEEAKALFDELNRRIEARGSDGLDGVEHPGRLYVTLIDAAIALDQAESARQFARAAIALLNERARHVSEADRESYLSGVPAHRSILELAAKLGVLAG